MSVNPILDVPLTDVMRLEIALPRQQVLHLYTVGAFLQAWANPRNPLDVSSFPVLQGWARLSWLNRLP